MTLRTLLISASVAACSFGQTQISELRSILKSPIGTASVDRYLEIADRGDGESRLFALCNLDKLWRLGAIYFEVADAEKAGLTFARELRNRKNLVEVKMLLRAGIGVEESDPLPTFRVEGICGVGLEVSEKYGELVVAALISKPAEMASLMGESCGVACRVAHLLQDTRPDLARKGLKPWLTSKKKVEREAAAAVLIWLASTQEDGRLMKPILENMEVVDADYAHSRLMSRMPQIYPTFADMPTAIAHNHLLRMEPSRERDANLDQWLSGRKELPGGIAMGLMLQWARDPSRATKIYHLSKKALETVEWRYEFVPDFNRIEAYFGLFDSMLKSENWTVRVAAGRATMRAVGEKRPGYHAVADRYILALLREPRAEVRATTRAAITSVSGDLKERIREVLTKDGVDLPPPVTSGTSFELP